MDAYPQRECVSLEVYALGRRVVMTSDSSAIVIAVVTSGLSLACNADRALTTAPSPNSSMTRPLLRAIAIGEEIQGVAPSDGTLRARHMARDARSSRTVAR